MARKPVLILGGLGQVGQALVTTAEAAGRAPNSVRALSRTEVDVLDRQAVESALQQHQPAAVVNCAVFQPVDLCESEPEKAFLINAIAAGWLATSCRAAGVRLLHLSTDYVFGGERQMPYREEHCPRPLSLYAASKLAGEHLVLAAASTHAVVRASAIFGHAAPGHGSRSFVERMLQRAQEGKPTQVVRDQIVSPTYAIDLAQTLWELLRCGASGLYHVANRGQCSWFELASRVFVASGRRDLLRPTTAAEFGAPARRPRFSVLDTARLRDLGIQELPAWEHALSAFLAAAIEDGSSDTPT